MRVLLALVLAACAARPSPVPVANVSPPRRERIEVAFASTTIAFHWHGMRRDGDPPERLDDRPCPAAGAEWAAAEDATIDALRAAIPTVRALEAWRGRSLVMRRADPVSWRDEHAAISQRRYRGDPTLDASLRVTRDGGYLILWGPPGVHIYCFDVARAGDAVTLVPRIVEWTDF